VFEDYACPHCRDYTLDVAPDVYAAFTTNGRVRYEFHDLPIPVADRTSWQAASAAREVLASRGNRAFWTYNGLLFEHQNSLGPDTYASLAGEVGADPEAVRTAAVEGRYRAAVEADRQRAIDMGAEGTPAVFVDGDLVQPTFEAIRAAIEG
jgi:protein-disulfide isomerase